MTNVPTDKPPSRPAPRPRKPTLPRVGFTMNEAAKMTGKTPAALRREIERRATAEGDELVAHLVAGIVARKRKDGGRWFIIVPAELRG